MKNDMVKEIIENIYTTAESAEYLGISKQRLNKMVHDGLVMPIKDSKSIQLFYRDDLDDIIMKENSISKNYDLEEINMESKYVKESILYFTVQHYMKGSDRKTIDFFNKTILLEKSSNNTVIDYDTIASYLGVSKNDFLFTYNKVLSSYKRMPKDTFIIKKGDLYYSKLLNDVEEAPEYLFLRGNKNLLNSNCVSVVGSRNASQNGIANTKILVEALSQRNTVIVAGLAKGIDTCAHETALNCNGKTIAVIGTPINEYYPKENRELQDRIAKEGLLVSQFSPYSKTERWNFPIRNATMSGMSMATIIMEAGETSGALIQANYALKQKRLVLIPNSAVRNDKISWPKKYISKGANEFSTLKDILTILTNNEVLKTTDVQGEDSRVQMDE